MTIGKPRKSVPDDILEFFASENWMDPNLEHQMFIPWEDWKFKDPIYDSVIMTTANRGSAKMEPSVIRPNLQYQEKLSK